MKKDIRQEISEKLDKIIEQENKQILETTKTLEESKNEPTKKLLDLMWIVARCCGKLEGIKTTVEVFNQAGKSKEIEEQE